MGLLGIVSKRLQVSRHVEMQVLLRRLHQFQDLLFSESLAVFRVVVQEIGQPSLEWQRLRCHIQEAVVAAWHRDEPHHGPLNHEDLLQSRRTEVFC